MPALRDRLLRDVLLPLGATWLAGTLIATGIAHLFTQRALDRALLDDAYLLASNVRLQGGKLRLELTESEIRTVMFDQAETMYFSIRDGTGNLIAGHPWLALSPPEPPARFYLDEVVFNGRVLRAVILQRDEPASFEVTVGQTRSVRTTLLHQLILYSLLPQLVLLITLAIWLRRSISQDLQPLSQLEEAVENRSVDDLQPVNVQATTHDVYALAQALNALLRRLEDSVRAQREFTGNVAHELRTPLAGIRALASYGLAHEEPQVWREQLKAIVASESRVSRLIDKLLALAVAAEAEAGLRLVPVNLSALVRDAVLRFLPRADAAQVDLGARGIEHAVEVQGDATLIDGILDNLIDNALRYGVPTGTEGATITVAIETSAENVTLVVQDNGTGLPGEQQQQLMRRGVQGETGQLLGQGAGLGLALVAQYARLMRGSMTLGQGADGHGWACRIHFPRLQPLPEGARPGSTPPK